MSINNIENDYGFYNLKFQLAEHVYSRSDKCFERDKKVREGLSSAAQLKEYTEKMRERFVTSMGQIPYNPKLPLNAMVTGVIEDEDLTIEKIIFMSRPNVYVTANLYIPKKRKEPCGAVLFQCGHAVQGKANPQYQRVARIIALSGLIVLVQDPVGQGERYSYIEKVIKIPIIPPTTQDHDYAGIQCFLTGDSPARCFISDAMRGIDYLQSRPEVDKSKIGLTGSSGGGTMTAHMMVCDSRPIAAAPATFITTRGAYLRAGDGQDAEQIWLDATHYGFDHHELMMCFAPKPLLILAVDSDFFPIDGTCSLYKDLKRFWEMSGKGSDFELFVDQSTHKFTDTLAARAGYFFAKALNGEDRRVFPAEVREIEPHLLNCTKTGQVATEYPDAKFIYHENLERYREKRSLTNKVEWLREKVDFERRPVDFNLRTFYTHYENGLFISHMLWFTQDKIACHGIMFKDFDKKDEKLPVEICLWGDGTDDIENNIRFIRKICDKCETAFVVDLTGIGKSEPDAINPKGLKEADGTISKLNKDLIFLNDSLCAMRVYDLERTVEMLKTLPNAGVISLFGKGFSAVYVNLYKILHEEMKTETEDDVSPREIVENKYYENYNIG
ncbi:MAG: hypothetical protein GX800_04570, partial [Clostridiaceae bacterium]|nr:hypothetical protein [Clostridiaceae bacterium]